MENNLLLAIFVILAATVALVPLFKAWGLGTILGYLVTGVLIGPYGIGLITDSDTIRHISEFGIVMMLFLIGLELQPSELWRLRKKVAGLGLTQLAGTSVILGLIAFQFGATWQQSVLIGLALSMSSTAIALQSVAARGITQTGTGRGSLAILLVQDVAVIPILALVPLLAVGSALPVESSDAGHDIIRQGADWTTALQIVVTFGVVIVAGRYLVRPLLRLIAMTGVREAFTALGLALVVGAALVTSWFGLSPALGAFMGGVLLSDSEYRHELESNLEPFKGLLLGLFFITVGTSIAFSVLAERPAEILGMVLVLVAIKAAVIFGLTGMFRMHIADRVLLAFLLSQGGEFAFVILQFAQSANSIGADQLEMLTVVVALSMAVTPLLLFLFDRFIDRANQPAANDEATTPEIHGSNKVVMLGYGRFGQIVTRLLRAQGFEMTLIDDDPAQIELMKKFGVKVFYGDGARLDILRAAGVAQAELVVISVAGRDRISEIAQLVRTNFPNVKIAARAVDRRHAHSLIEIGVDIFERETFRSALALGHQALGLLGYSAPRANRLAQAFADHDSKMLRESWELRHDTDAYIGYLRQSTEMLNDLMQADWEKTGNKKPPAPNNATRAKTRSKAKPAAKPSTKPSTTSGPKTTAKRNSGARTKTQALHVKSSTTATKGASTPAKPQTERKTTARKTTKRKTTARKSDAPKSK